MRSTRPSPGGPTARTGTGTPTSTRRPTAPSSATSVSCGARRDSPRTRPACSVTSPAATCSRSVPGPGQCSRWVAAQGGRPIGLDLSHRQLQHSRRIDADSGVAVPAVLGTATHLPFADDTFDVVFCSFGALQFVSDLDRAVAETARVLRPGGRFAFSITHPTRWMFPDDPGEAGLVASQSYWDRTPYVEVDDETGVVAYVEHHRTLGDWVALLAGHGFAADRPARAGVARGSRPGLGRLVGHARAVHPRHRDLRRRPPVRLRRAAVPPLRSDTAAREPRVRSADAAGRVHRLRGRSAPGPRGHAWCCASPDRRRRAVRSCRP